MPLGPNEKEVSLATLNGGAAIEIFDRALKTVLENINDINAARKTKPPISSAKCQEATAR